jgi:spermidine synthase
VENVLILGGGDGLAVREALKHPSVKSVTLVDIDPRMTALGRTYPAIRALNRGVLDDRRVKLVHADAYKHLEQSSTLYDVIVGDLPDPNSDALAKLYSVEFFRLVKRRLAASGLFVTQASSPFFSRDSFWCVARTMREAGFKTAPYHAYVPSFGDWGYIIGSGYAVKREGASIRVQTKFLNDTLLKEMFVFGKDSAEVDVEVSTLDHPRILSYYLNDTRQWE